MYLHSYNYLLTSVFRVYNIKFILYLIFTCLVDVWDVAQTGSNDIFYNFMGSESMGIEVD